MAKSIMAKEKKKKSKRGKREKRGKKKGRETTEHPVGETEGSTERRDD